MKNKIINLIAFFLSLALIFLLEASPLGLLAEDINPLEKKEVEIKLLLSASNNAGDIQNQIEESNLEKQTEELDKNSLEKNKKEQREENNQNQDNIREESLEDEIKNETAEVENPEKEYSSAENMEKTEELTENKSEPPAWLKKPEAEVEENIFKAKKIEEKIDKFDLENFIADLDKENSKSEQSAENGGISNKNLEKSRTEKKEKIKENKSSKINDTIKNNSKINKDENKVYDLRKKKADEIKKPGIINYTVPEYPSKLRKRNIESKVIVSLRIDKKGKSHDLKINKSSGYNAFDQAALEAVKTWEFEAAELKGNKVEVIVNIPIRFQLN